jgi:hypothetical protein
VSAREALAGMRERAEAIDEPGLDSNQYREALESSAADVPALVEALEAVEAKLAEGSPQKWGAFEVGYLHAMTRIREAIETALEAP